MIWLRAQRSPTAAQDELDTRITLRYAVLSLQVQYRGYRRPRDDRTMCFCLVAARVNFFSTNSMTIDNLERLRHVNCDTEKQQVEQLRNN
jgi:hypothetical protein